MPFTDVWHKFGFPAIEAFFNWQREKQVNAAIKRLYDQADLLAVNFVQFVISTLWWANHLASAMADARGYSAQILDATNKAAERQQETWSDFLLRKYPADLQSLYRQVLVDLEAANRAGKRSQATAFGQLAKEIRQLEQWKCKTVTPDIAKLNRFYRTWQTTYAQPANIFRHWLKSPSAFAAWATPSLIASLPSALQQAKSQRSARLIEQTLVATWTNDPAAIWSLIQRWLITEQ